VRKHYGGKGHFLHLRGRAGRSLPVGERRGRRTSGGGCRRRRPGAGHSEFGAWAVLRAVGLIWVLEAGKDSSAQMRGVACRGATGNRRSAISLNNKETQQVPSDCLQPNSERAAAPRRQATPPV